MRQALPALRVMRYATRARQCRCGTSAGRAVREGLRNKGGKMKRTRTLLMLLVLGGVNACTAVPYDAPAYSRAPAPEPGQATLYIYRTGAFPKARAPRVNVDGRRVFDPPEGAYTMLTLPSGPHQVEMSWSFGVRLPTRTVLVTLGDRGAQYLKITGDFDYQPGSADDDILVDLTAGIMSQPKMYSWIVEVPRDAAEDEMRDCCRYLPPER